MRPPVEATMTETIQSPAAAPIQALDVEAIRADFPILTRAVRGGKPLVYLDNAASSQKPKRVIDALSDYYSRYNANVHRGIHTLSEEATDEYEKPRRKIQAFINARHSAELIFVPNTPTPTHPAPSPPA